MAVESPCNAICRLDPVSGLCIGCRRTIDEIMAWPTADDVWKQDVLDRLKRRRVKPG